MLGIIPSSRPLASSHGENSGCNPCDDPSISDDEGEM